jgi:hypothetical protein
MRLSPERRPSVDQEEFTKLHGECDTLRRDYFGETEKTSKMLAKCTLEPLSFKERLALAAQGIVENDAHRTYLGMRDLLLEAARLGYGFTN